MAARWYARGVAPGTDLALHPAFARWLDASPAHRAAWQRLADADRQLAAIAGDDRLGALLAEARTAAPRRFGPLRRKR